MRRGMWIGVLLLMVLVGVAVGVGAYNAGLSEGLERTGSATEVVRYVGPGFGFGFGWLLFPLFFFGIFFLLRGAFWRRRWEDHGEHGRGGPWAGRFEDWHRRQHEEGSGARAGDDTGTV
jgi:hypothetical protein